MRKTLGVAGLAAICIVAGAAHAAHAVQLTAADRAAAERVAVGTCANCHGRRGHSISPMFPVLAGQHAWYLVQQLKAFKARTRGDPNAIAYMWGMAAPLSNTLIQALADYYSHQKPRAGPRLGSRLIARGNQIYHHGDTSSGVPPCAVCHGPSGRGSKMYPRLAGQHVEYLLQQLHSFRNNLRKVAIMHGIAGGLHRSQMRAVASYVQQLGPDPR